MKFNELDTDVHHLEQSIESMNQELKDVMSAGRGLLCGSCEFFFIGVARRTGAFKHAFSLAVRDVPRRPCSPLFPCSNSIAYSN